MRILIILMSCLVGCAIDKSDQSQTNFASKLATKINVSANAPEDPFAEDAPLKKESLNLAEEKLDSIFHLHPQFISDGFDFPVGKPDGRNYMKALNFGQRLHLGEDWNGVGGGNSDLGDPVYSISSGIVTVAEKVCCGWGNVVRVIHKVPDSQSYDYVESVYAHLHDFVVQPGDFVMRGERIGSIGTGDGAYMAHLHLEMRSFINMSLGPGYSEDQFGFMDPTHFIKKHRPGRR